MVGEGARIRSRAGIGCTCALNERDSIAGCCLASDTDATVIQTEEIAALLSNTSRVDSGIVFDTETVG